MIIGQFTDSFYPLLDGVANASYNYHMLINETDNHSCYTIAPWFPNCVEPAGNILRVKSIPIFFEKYRFSIPGLDVKFKQSLISRSFNLIHAHDPFACGKYAYKVARKRNIPCVATFHSKYAQDFRKVFKFDFMVKIGIQKIRRFYRKVDVVWVPSEGTIDTIREYGFKGNVDVVPNGSDIGAKSLQEKEQLTQKGLEILRATPDSSILLYVGQCRWEKNLRFLLHSLKILRGAYGNFQMRFVGSGGDIKQMQKLTHQLKLSNVEFIGPVNDRTLLKSCYAASDLLLSPAHYDNAPIVVKEAAGFFLPGLFIAGTTAAKGIIDKKNGYVSENTPLAFARKIQYIINNAEQRIQVGKGAHSSLYCPWKRVISVVLNKYQEIIVRYNNKRDV